MFPTEHPNKYLSHCIHLASWCLVEIKLWIIRVVSQEALKSTVLGCAITGLSHLLSFLLSFLICVVVGGWGEEL